MLEVGQATADSSMSGAYDWPEDEVPGEPGIEGGDMGIGGFAEPHIVFCQSG